MASRYALLTLISLVLPACNGGKNGGGSSDGGEDDSGATLGMSSDPSSGGPGEPTGGGAETGGVGGSTSESTGEVSSSATSSAESTGGSSQTPCQAACATQSGCGLLEDVAACVTICTTDTAALMEPCKSATEATLVCLAGLRCELLEAALDGGSSPCASTQFEQTRACGEPSCDWGAGGDFGGAQCELMIFCPGEPELNMKCDTETCVCLEGGVEVGGCPANDACLNLGDIQDKGPGCCGFPEVEP